MEGNQNVGGKIEFILRMIGNQGFVLSTKHKRRKLM